MVYIKYYPNPIDDAAIIGDFNSISEFLLAKFTTRDELLDLRFFDGELLGEEISQENGDFLSISDGSVCITRDSMIARGPETWAYVALAVIFAAAAIILAPTVPRPEGRDQTSGTNSLGAPSNEPRVGQRINDVFGTVNKHVPSLWQVPYRIGVNNQETEIMYVCVGRGKYEMDVNKWYDGSTPMINIPNASVSAYGPNTHPGNGVPVLQIGDTINEPIGVYRKSNDLNPSELLPPNELENSSLQWLISGVGSVGTLKATFIPDDFDFENYYSIGQEITMSQLVYFENDVNARFAQISETGNVYNARNVQMLTNPVDIGVNKSLFYTVTNVTSDTLTLDIPVTSPVDVLNAWASMTNYVPKSLVFNVKDNTGYDKYTLDSYIPQGEWFREISAGPVYTTEPISVTFVRYNKLVGVPFNNGVGPVFVPENSTQIILNFVSESGFYKLNGNNEEIVIASINVLQYELDSEGNETGNVHPTDVSYTSNPVKTRDSVFRTARINLVYQHSKIFAERATDRDKNTDISNVDIIKWRDFYSFEPVVITDLGDVTTAHIVVPSNSQSQLIKDRKQNLDVTRLITEYQGNGVFGPVESYATDQFDQIIIHQSLDPFIGRLTLDDVNADGFMSVRQHMIDYFGSDNMCKFGYDFDSTNMTYQDTFMLVSNVVMCLPYVQAGVYDLFFERKQETSSMQITCRNKKFETETRKTDYDSKHDGVELTYRDNDTSTTETVYLPVDQSATNPDRIEMSGCTTRVQAFRHAHRVRAKQKYQFEEIVFDVDEFGKNVIPGKRIDSPDSTRFTYRESATDNGYRVYDGEVIEVNGLNVELSEPISFTLGEDHYITFTKRNGDNGEPILCTYVDNYTVKLNTLPTESIYNGYSSDRTKFVFMSEQLNRSVAMLPKTIEFSLSDSGEETNTITSVNYSDRYYEHDLELPQ
jgi:hypothetical protein